MSASEIDKDVQNAIQWIQKLVEIEPADASLREVLNQMKYLRNLYDLEKNFKADLWKGLHFSTIVARKGYGVAYPEFGKLISRIADALRRGEGEDLKLTEDGGRAPRHFSAKEINEDVLIAIPQVQKLLEFYPEDVGLKSVLEQFYYLRDLYNREKSFDACRGDRMNFGEIVAREELDNSFPRFGDLVFRISDALSRGEGKT